MLIGITGRIGSGKNEVARIVQELYPDMNWQERGFADRLRHVVSLLTGIPADDMKRQEVKEQFLGPEWGRANASGTITLLTVREFLQRLGTDAIRNNLHKNAFVNSLMSELTGYEEWRPIDWSNGNYIVSSLGRVMSIKRITIPRGNQKTRNVKAIILKPTTGSRGYDTVGINNKTVTVHQLVAKAFIPNPEENATVNHINGIRNDNRVQNLEWVSQKENIAHALAAGRFNALSIRKLSSEDVLRIIDRLNNGQTGASLSRQYNVSQSTISSIKHGEKYREITDASFEPLIYTPKIHIVTPNWLITDCRFPNELEAITSRNGICIRIVRPDNPHPQSNHESETALDGVELLTIINDGSLDQLRLRVKEVFDPIVKNLGK
jgi:hypothetical protein